MLGIAQLAYWGTDTRVWTALTVITVAYMLTEDEERLAEVSIEI